MKLAVTDANIFIDLIRLDLLHCLFSVEFELHTTENIIEELSSNQYNVLLPYIESVSIKVHLLTDEEMEKTAELNVSRKLSPPDLSAIVLALHIEAFVLTGDNLLRKHCEKHKLEVHGILWLFDLFISRQVISKNTAIEKLELLIEQNNRLPKEDCKKRLLEWKKVKPPTALTNSSTEL